MQKEGYGINERCSCFPTKFLKGIFHQIQTHDFFLQCCRIFWLYSALLNITLPELMWTTLEFFVEGKSAIFNMWIFV